MAFQDFLETQFDIAEDVTFEKQEGFVVISDQRHGTIFGLDPNATFFWEALAAGHTPEVVVQQVLSHCPATREEVERDLAELLDRWLELDLVQAASA